MKKALLLSALALALPSAAYSGDITVQADRAKKIRGGVIFKLYDKESYLKEPLREIYRPLNADGSATATFRNVAPGTYAVIAIHDKNGNRKMDTNFLGIPTEKGGFSNNAPARFGPAKFRKAAFRVGAERVVLTIHLTQ